MKVSRRFQVLPCRAFCLHSDDSLDTAPGDCAWMAEADGDHEQVRIAALDHFRETGHQVKIIMTRTVTIGPAEEEVAGG